MQRFNIFHETEYHYASPVQLGAHKLLVRPRDGHDLRIEASRLAISPNAIVSWHRDELDNSVALATFDSTPTLRLSITSEVTVTHYQSLRDELPLVESVKKYPFQYSETEQTALVSYRVTLPEGERFRHWLDEYRSKNADTMDLLLGLSQKVFDQCSYEVREEHGVQTADETLFRAKGSCRDSAWLFVASARSLGFAARFVSGYFHTAGTALADGTTHAWVEVYLPGPGWTGLDPSCNRLTAENHIPVAVALSPENVPPVSGLFTGAAGESSQMSVKVRVTPA